MWHSSDISLYGFSMALNIDCLHNLGTLFYVKHLLSHVASCAKLDLDYLAVLLMPAAFLFLGASIPILYCSSESVHQRHFPAASVCSTEC